MFNRFLYVYQSVYPHYPLFIHDSWLFPINNHYQPWRFPMIFHKSFIVYQRVIYWACPQIWSRPKDGSHQPITPSTPRTRPASVRVSFQMGQVYVFFFFLWALVNRYTWKLYRYRWKLYMKKKQMVLMGLPDIHENYRSVYQKSSQENGKSLDRPNISVRNSTIPVAKSRPSINMPLIFPFIIATSNNLNSNYQHAINVTIVLVIIFGCPLCVLGCFAGPTAHWSSPLLHIP